MPLIASHHQQRIRQVTVTFPEYGHSTDPDKTLSVWYRPEAYTAAQDAIADEITATSAVIDAINDDDALSISEKRSRIQETNRRHTDTLFSLFGETLADWDLFEDADQQQKVPFTPETFERFRATVQRITEAIGEYQTSPNRSPSRVSNGRTSNR